MDPSTTEFSTKDIFTLIVASIALVAAIWHGIAIRRHHRLIVRPILSFRTDFRRDEYKGLWLVNEGMGPAIIESIKVWVNGEEIPEPESGGKVRAGLKRWGLDLTPFNTGTISEHTILRSTQRIAIARTRKKDRLDKQSWELRKALTDIDIEFKYSSVYKERSHVRLGYLLSVDETTYNALEAAYAVDQGEGTVDESPGGQTEGQET